MGSTLVPPKVDTSISGKSPTNQHNDQSPGGGRITSFSIRLPHNSLLVCWEGFQEFWRHEVPKDKGLTSHSISGPARLNFTFRKSVGAVAARKPMCHCGRKADLKPVLKASDNRGRYFWTAPLHCQMHIREWWCQDQLLGHNPPAVISDMLFGNRQGYGDACCRYFQNLSWLIPQTCIRPPCWSLGMATDLLLSERQVSLLDELTSSVNSSLQEAVDAEKGNSFEAFHKHWQSVRHRHLQQEASKRRGRWQWICQVQEICNSACEELDTVLGQLKELDRQRCEVLRKTTALHKECEQMVQDQERLAAEAEALAERLDYFDRVADVACMLDHQSANGLLATGTSTSSSGSDLATVPVLDQIDGSLSFLELHPDFCQAQPYTHQFEHLRNRACLALRSTVQRSLEKSLAQVEQQLKDGGSVQTQVFYSQFKAAAASYRPLLSLLHQRLDIHETYAVTLEELEGFFVHLRLKLLTLPVSTHLQSIVHKDLEMNQLAPATRQASAYILEVSQMEHQCFEAYFELRQPQEALRSLMETIADIFYQTMRPLVLACDSIDSLREIGDSLQSDVLEPQRQSRIDLVSFLGMVYRLHKDVQEKLIYRVEMYIRDSIKGYVPSNSDLDYPWVLYSAERQEDPLTESQTGWYPSLPRTLSILAKIYRALEMSTFQGIAQEAVDLCMHTLKEASQILARKSLPSCSDRNMQAVLPLVQMMDSQLFLVKHLLLLREQVAAFECELVVSEKYFNFGNLWEALNLKLPDGILGILKPTMYHAEVDSKKDIESELKSACETLITNITAHITQPMAAMNVKIGNYLANPQVDRASLKEQSFMKEELHGVISTFLDNVKVKVPFATAHIRLYLSTPGGTDSSRSTSPILFKPVEMRLVDTWGRLEGLLEEQNFSAEELTEMGFIRPDALRELISSLFNSVMEAPWENVVETVAQVPRNRSQVPKAMTEDGAPVSRQPSATPSTASVERNHSGALQEPGADTAPVPVAPVAPPPPVAPAGIPAPAGVPAGEEQAAMLVEGGAPPAPMGTAPAAPTDAVESGTRL
eukprot:s2578_g5.t4